MKRLILLAAAIAFLPGCITDLGLRYGNTTPSATQPSVGPGASISGGGVSARVSDGPAFGAVIGAGILSVIFGGAPRKPPELDQSRAVQEQDCTRPIENPGANLRCR